MKKKCSVCRQSKEESEFHKGQRECKACKKLRDQKNYLKNKDKILMQSATLKKKTREYVDSFKTECSICGENRTACLDFHHESPEEKEIAVSNLAGYSLKKIDEEIAKCIVLCANCHRILHSK